MQPDATDLRSGRLAGCDLAPSAPATAKWRFRPSKKRHLAPFSITFLRIFSGFFRELAHRGANWRACGPETVRSVTRKRSILNLARTASPSVPPAGRRSGQVGQTDVLVRAVGGRNAAAIGALQFPSQTGILKWFPPVDREPAEADKLISAPVPRRQRWLNGLPHIRTFILANRASLARASLCRVSWNWSERELHPQTSAATIIRIFDPRMSKRAYSTPSI